MLDGERVELVLARLAAAVERRSSGTVWGWLPLAIPEAVALPALWSLDAWAAEGPRLRWRAPRSSERSPERSAERRSSRSAATDVVAVGAARLLCAEGEGRFATIRRRGSRILRRVEAVALDGSSAALPEWARPRWFGGFAFRPTTGHSTPGPGSEGCWSDFPDAAFILPELAIQRHGDGSVWVLTLAIPCEGGLGPRRLRRVARRLRVWSRQSSSLRETVRPPGRPPVAGPRRDVPCPTRRALGEDAAAGHDDYRDRVARALDAIEAGQLDKVVVARNRGIESGLDQKGLMERLDALEDATTFGFGLGRSLFFGATPERLVAVHGRHVRTEALAGTRPLATGSTTNVLGSPKDQNEHGHVVDDLKTRLAPRCSVLECADPRERIAGPVVHLNTPIHGVLRREEHVLDLVAELHPTPAVGGTPRPRALDWIEQQEGLDRGWYAAPLGWFDARGAGEFVVALRSGVWRGPLASAERTASGESSRVELFAGAGIVAGSVPDAEAAETEHKFDALRGLLAEPCLQNSGRDAGQEGSAQ